MKVDMQWSCISWTCRKPCKAKRDSQQNDTQNHVEYRWCTKWMACNKVQTWPHFCQGFLPNTVNVHKPKTWGVFLDFCDHFFWEKNIPRGEAPAWPLKVVWYIFIQHLLSQIGCEDEFPLPYMEHVIIPWYIFQLIINDSTTVFFCQYIFWNHHIVQFSYTFSLADDFFTPPQKWTAGRNLNINLNQLNPGTSSKLQTNPSITS